MVNRDNLTDLAKRLKPFLPSGGGGGGTGGGTVSEGPGIDLVVAGADTQVGLGGDTILLYHCDGAPVTEYALTGAGLDLASAAASAGDVVILPACTIDGDHTLTADVGYMGINRDKSVLSGTITLTDGSVLTNLSVIISESSATEVDGVIGPAGETDVATISEVTVSVTNSGSGDAAGLLIIPEGKVIADHCIFNAVSSGGHGYGVRVAMGTYTGTMYSYDDPYITVHSSFGAARETLPLEGTGGDCADIDTCCTVIDTVVGPAYVIYDLGRIWTLDHITTRRDCCGEIGVWNIPVWDPDLANWGHIWWENRSWTEPCETYGYDVPHPIYQGTKLCRYLRFDVIEVFLVGNAWILANFQLDGNTETDETGTGELYYCRIGGTEKDIKTSLQSSHISLYACEFGSYDGLITPLAGDRSAWDDVGYGTLHAQDISDGVSLHHLPAVGDEGDVLTVDSGVPTWSPIPALANHDHSGNAGDGGTFDAANLTSGASGDGDVLTSDGAGGAAWEPSSGAVTRMSVFTVSGSIAVGTGCVRIYNKLGVTVTISQVFIAVNTAPTGASIKVDVNIDGTTIFTTQSNRPEITATNFTGTALTIESDQLDDGEYLTMDIDQVGSTVPGSNLTVHVIYS